MTSEMQRRSLSGGAIAGTALLHGRAFARFEANQTVIPWADQPPLVPPLANVARGLTPTRQTCCATR